MTGAQLRAGLAVQVDQEPARPAVDYVDRPAASLAGHGPQDAVAGDDAVARLAWPHRYGVHVLAGVAGCWAWSARSLPQTTQRCFGLSMGARLGT